MVPVLLQLMHICENLECFKHPHFLSHSPLVWL